MLFDLDDGVAAVDAEAALQPQQCCPQHMRPAMLVDDAADEDADDPRVNEQCKVVKQLLKRNAAALGFSFNVGLT